MIYGGSMLARHTSKAVACVEYRVVEEQITGSGACMCSHGMYVLDQMLARVRAYVGYIMQGWDQELEVGIQNLSSVTKN
jgi:hypothetical protein